MTRHCQAGSLHALAALAALVLGMQSGCQVSEIRSGPDPYYVSHGMWCGNYHVGVAQARVATLTALTELKMPLFQEGPLPYGVFVDTRTIDEHLVRIEIRSLGVRRRAEGEVVRIGVRVGGFGTHREVCEGLLDEIARRLAPAPPPALPIPPPSPAAPPVTTAPAASAPPAEPGLPSQPVPVGK
jgi:hypothetical protein